MKVTENTPVPAGKTTWQEKKIGLGPAIIGAVVTLALGIVIGINWNTLFAKFGPYLGFSSKTSATTDWSSLDEVYAELKNNYDGEIDEKAIIEGAKKGLAEAVGDIYTQYMSKEETAEFNKTLHGDVGAGIGVEIAKRGDYVRVVRTLPDNPARRAGILAGDIIYKINGEEVWQLDPDALAMKLRGEAGTKVNLTVIHENGEEQTYDFVRETINNVSADVEYQNDVAIIKISRFDTDTGTKVREIAKDFASKGVNKVIIDLRNNGGGYVSAARDLISLWVSNQPAFVQKSLHTADETTTTRAGWDILKDMETVVLVNNSTASASEIVAGALQDYGKATIIGETTYGKGVFQKLVTLSNGSLLKVTMARWYTPKGTSINGAGITPDKIIERSYDDINNNRDPQLDAALAE